MNQEEINNTDEKTSIWKTITGYNTVSRMPVWGRMLLALAIVAAFIFVTWAMHNGVPADTDPGASIDYPENWTIGWEVMKFIDKIVDWIVVSWDPFFSGINVFVLRYILVPIESFFLWIPWWSILLITGLLAWKTVSLKFAALTVIFLGLMASFGMLDLGSMTLAITLSSALICVVFGIPIGIIAAKSTRFDNLLRPVLDMMQTMPSFVYLIPALMLFGLGRTPAVFATCIYAIPPIIRLTTLGIRQVDASVVEASKSFGATPWQLLTKVQVPLAMPTILAGLNQTVMMALAMVVIASMIGAQGLGTEILRAINRLEVGRGLVAGVSIVFMAIILDRISQGFVKQPENRQIT